MRNQTGRRGGDLTLKLRSDVYNGKDISDYPDAVRLQHVQGSFP